jgi:hypothetical protein
MICKTLKSFKDINAFVEPENKIAFVTFSHHINLYEAFEYKFGVSSSFKADEVVSLSYFYISAPIHLREILNLKASQLYESGIYKHAFNKQYKIRDPVKVFRIGPQVLTLKHLEAGFVVFCSFLSLSFIVFVIEKFELNSSVLAFPKIFLNQTCKIILKSCEKMKQTIRTNVWIMSKVKVPKNLSKNLKHSKKSKKMKNSRKIIKKTLKAKNKILLKEGKGRFIKVKTQIKAELNSNVSVL